MWEVMKYVVFPFVIAIAAILVSLAVWEWDYHRKWGRHGSEWDKY